MATTGGGADGLGPVRPSGGQPLRRSVRGVQWWVGAALLLAAVFLLTGALLASVRVPSTQPSPPAPGPPAAAPTPGPSSPSPAPAASPAAAGPTVPAAKAWRPTPVPFARVPQPDEMPERDLRPARIRIPALGVDRRPVALRVLDDGSLQAPRRYPDVGWWKDGPRPGAKGNAVVVGHVDSATGPAVFYGLASLQPGDPIAVTRRDASAVQFRVRTVQRFRLADFPADRVYRRDGPPGLVLITCGGTYDRAAGRYLDNVVVFADHAR